MHQFDGNDLGAVAMEECLALICLIFLTGFPDFFVSWLSYFFSLKEEGYSYCCGLERSFFFRPLLNFLLYEMYPLFPLIS